MEKVLVINQLHPDAIRVLEGRKDIRHEILDNPTREELIAGLADATAVTVRMTPITADLISSAPLLKVVSRHGVGYDNVDIDACSEHGVAVAIIGPINADTVAEHTMFLMLSAARAGIMVDSATREGDFGICNRVPTFELQNKTLLIVGFGRIGQRVARLARAFEMDVTVHDPFVAPDASSGVRVVPSLEDALAKADVLTMHVPLTDETRHMISHEQIARMPWGSIVVNASRGGVVDESALLDAVRSGQLFGAGLDVFEDEPLPASSPLATEKRIVLSPHSASLSAETLVAMGIKTVENALDAIDGHLDPGLVVNRSAIFGPGDPGN